MEVQIDTESWKMKKLRNLIKRFFTKKIKDMQNYRFKGKAKKYNKLNNK